MDDFLKEDIEDSKRKALFGGFHRLANTIKTIGACCQNSGMKFTQGDLVEIEVSFKNYKEKVAILEKYVIQHMKDNVDVNNSANITQQQPLIITKGD